MSETIPEKSKIKILIVDDSAVVRKIISNVLLNQGDMEVAGSVGNGLLGVEFIRKTPPDLVLRPLYLFGQG